MVWKWIQSALCEQIERGVEIERKIIRKSSRLSSRRRDYEKICCQYDIEEVLANDVTWRR